MNKQNSKDNGRSNSLSSQQSSIMDHASGSNRVPANNEKLVDSVKPKRDDVCLYINGTGCLTKATREYRFIVQKAAESSVSWSKQVYTKIRKELGKRSFLIRIADRRNEWCRAREGLIQQMTAFIFEMYCKEARRKKHKEEEEEVIGEETGTSSSAEAANDDVLLNSRSNNDDNKGTLLYRALVKEAFRWH